MTRSLSHLFQQINWYGERLPLRPVGVEDGPRLVAAAALCSVEDLRGNIVAVARLAKDVCRKSAEFALIVRTDLQNRGLGTLMHKLLENYALRDVITELWGIVDEDNRKVLHLMRQLEYRISFQAGLPSLRVSKSLG